MKVKVNVRETVEHEVWLEVDDPDDRGQMEVAWTNLPREQAEEGFIGYEDREFRIMDVESIYPSMALDKLIDALQEAVTATRGMASRLEALGRHDAPQEWSRADGLTRALNLAISHRDAYEGRKP